MEEFVAPEPDPEEQFVSHEAEVEADGLEEMYQEAHKAIREDPWKKDDEDGNKKTKEEWKAEGKKYRKSKMSKEEKEARIQAKISELAS